ncbi:MAG: flagellar protein FliT [Lachnospiraceae bacterium]|nr:flagellar protein FliT [Lachnospiraceae bacterium]MDD7177416.1 flagellar protein FliT [bacterium]MDY5516644.1 flagellar protein FliT [Lachnospiraceae bacterium]
MREEEYLELLIQSLKKKLLLLNRISVLNQDQRDILQDENADPDAFDINVRDKDDLIQQIVTLDAGFDEVYAHIKELMERDHSAYEEQLEEMRGLIRQIMANDASIRVEEQRNYKLAQQKFAAVKKQVREVKASQKMVNSYYQNMMKQSRYQPQYMDRKK